MSSSPDDMIKVEKIIPMSGSGSLKAFASVRLGGIIVHDFRIVQQPGKDAWLSPPQKEVSKNGERKFFPVVELSENLKKAVADKVLEAWGAMNA